ncbi:TraR/DksA C4-type zinc finger protein [Paraburkholderia sp. BR13444]|uniref:TraR/DksA C4-type zinc finger protein n=1 Tax=Paraburkholderia TaxID=1822464 RepID=UPI0034CFE723
MCIDCGNPIDHARLAAAPYAARCLACQVQYERHASGALRWSAGSTGREAAVSI